MLKIFKNKKAQNTAEYAILIALVIGGVVAMQTYAQRALQGRIRDAAVKFRDETINFGNTLQYEPYYTNTVTESDRSSTKEEAWDKNTSESVSTKLTSSSDMTTYISNAITYNAGYSGF